MDAPASLFVVLEDEEEMIMMMIVDSSSSSSSSSSSKFLVLSLLLRKWLILTYAGVNLQLQFCLSRCIASPLCPLHRRQLSCWCFLVTSEK